MGEKGTGEKEKASFVPYELFIQSSNELTISNSTIYQGALNSEFKDQESLKIITIQPTCVFST